MKKVSTKIFVSFVVFALLLISFMVLNICAYNLGWTVKTRLSMNLPHGAAIVILIFRIHYLFKKEK